MSIFASFVMSEATSQPGNATQLLRAREVYRYINMERKASKKKKRQEKSPKVNNTQKTLN